MMCIILLLIKLTSCVCAGAFVINVTKTSYQAEENHNITLEFIFTTKTGSSLHSLYIYCELSPDLRPSVLFRLHGGVEVPESQDEQFTGRHVSRLRTDDSGLYMCDVFIKYGGSTAEYQLNVTVAGGIGLYVGLGQAAAALLAFCVNHGFIWFHRR